MGLDPVLANLSLLGNHSEFPGGSIQPHRDTGLQWKPGHLLDGFLTRPRRGSAELLRDRCGHPHERVVLLKRGYGMRWRIPTGRGLLDRLRHEDGLGLVELLIAMVLAVV